MAQGLICFRRPESQASRPLAHRTRLSHKPKLGRQEPPSVLLPKVQVRPAAFLGSSVLLNVSCLIGDAADLPRTSSCSSPIFSRPYFVPLSFLSRDTTEWLRASSNATLTTPILAPKAVGWTVAGLLRAWASDAITIADLVVGGRLDRSADGQHSSYELGAPYHPVILDVEWLEPAQDNANADLIMTVSGIPLATLVSPSGVAYIATRKEVKADANGHVQLVAGPQMLSHREGDRRNAKIFMPNVVFRAFEDKSGRVQIGKGPIVWQQLWPLYKPKPRDHAGTRILGDEAVKHLARHPGDAIWLAEVPAQVKGKEPLRVLFVSTLHAVKGGSTSSAAAVHHGTATHSLAHEALSLAPFRPEYTHRQRLIYRLPNYA